MRRIFLVISIIFLLTNCGKEKLNWDVIESHIRYNLSLVELHSDDFSEDNPYDTIPNTQYQTFIEKHEYKEGQYGMNYYRKEMVIEVKNNADDFYYTDEEIYQNLDCALWHFYSTNDDGYYRIHKGWVEGKRVNGKWQIDFSLFIKKTKR